jgi:hypothetical protein
MFTVLLFELHPLSQNKCLFWILKVKYYFWPIIYKNISMLLMSNKFHSIHLWSVQHKAKMFTALLFELLPLSQNKCPFWFLKVKSSYVWPTLYKKIYQCFWCLTNFIWFIMKYSFIAYLFRVTNIYTLHCKFDQS